MHTQDSTTPPPHLTHFVNQQRTHSSYDITSSPPPPPPSPSLKPLNAAAFLLPPSSLHRRSIAPYEHRRAWKRRRLKPPTFRNSRSDIAFYLSQQEMVLAVTTSNFIKKPDFFLKEEEDPEISTSIQKNMSSSQEETAADLLYWLFKKRLSLRDVNVGLGEFVLEECSQVVKDVLARQLRERRSRYVRVFAEDPNRGLYNLRFMNYTGGFHALDGDWDLIVAYGVRISGDAQPLAVELLKEYGSSMVTISGVEMPPINVVEDACKVLLKNLDPDCEETSLDWDEYTLDRSYVEVMELRKEKSLSCRTEVLPRVERELAHITRKIGCFMKKWSPILDEQKGMSGKRRKLLLRLSNQLVSFIISTGSQDAETENFEEATEIKENDDDAYNVLGQLVKCEGVVKIVEREERKKGICSKICVSGKSLGGHIRVHLPQIAASKKRQLQQLKRKLWSSPMVMINGEDGSYPPPPPLHY